MEGAMEETEKRPACTGELQQMASDAMDCRPHLLSSPFTFHHSSLTSFLKDSAGLEPRARERMLLYHLFSILLTQDRLKFPFCCFVVVVLFFEIMFHYIVQPTHELAM